MLTAQQLKLLEFIQAYMTTHRGVAPSLAEMADGIGQRSKSATRRILSRLEERGFIVRRPHQARAIDILRMPEGADPLADLESAVNRLRAAAGVTVAAAALTDLVRQMLEDERAPSPAIIAEAGRA